MQAERPPQCPQYPGLAWATQLSLSKPSGPLVLSRKTAPTGRRTPGHEPPILMHPVSSPLTGWAAKGILFVPTKLSPGHPPTAIPGIPAPGAVPGRPIVAPSGLPCSSWRPFVMAAGMREVRPAPHKSAPSIVCYFFPSSVLSDSGACFESWPAITGKPRVRTSDSGEDS